MWSTTKEHSAIEKLRVARNDDERESLVLMVLGIKSGFVKQLLSVAEQYVSRLVLDRDQEISALFKINTTSDYVLIGRCCFRPFTAEKFGEI